MSAPSPGRSGTHRYPSAINNFGEYSVSRRLSENRARRRYRLAAPFR